MLNGVRGKREEGRGKREEGERGRSYTKINFVCF